MAVKIILDQKVDLKNHVLLEGFPGIGLVGTIAAGYLVEKRKMIPVGHVYSDDFPPMTSIHEGKPYFPARLYKDPKADFCVLLAEFVMPSHLVYQISNEIFEFAKAQKIKQIVSLAGMTGVKQEDARQIYGIASNDEMHKYLTLKKIKMINEGVTTGISGVLLALCSVENFPAISLLSESNPAEPDPRASAEIVKSLDAIIGLKVDTKDLLGEAAKIEQNMGKLIEQGKKSKKAYEGVQPSMYQ